MITEGPSAEPSSGSGGSGSPPQTLSGGGTLCVQTPDSAHTCRVGDPQVSRAAETDTGVGEGSRARTDPVIHACDRGAVIN